MTCILSAIAVIIAAYAAAYWMTGVIINIHGREK